MIKKILVDIAEVTQQEAQAESPEATETGEAIAGTAQIPPQNKAAEQPVAKEPALTAEEVEVARLPAAAEANLKARRLTSPAGDNAWDNYMRVLELIPAHPEAVTGTKRVIGSYMELFVAAVEKEDFDKAAEHLSGVRDRQPDAPGLAEAEQRLDAVIAPEVEVRVKELVEGMVDIPAGHFRMGTSSHSGQKAAKPDHRVTVPDFKIGKYEVTFAQWDACVADGGCGGYRPGSHSWGGGNQPVMNVSWDDTQSFIDWLNDKTSGNFRLPTEAEWEYAARSGSTTKYSWGNRIGRNRANCWGCGSQSDARQTAPVGSFPANAWGLHDMHGNVWEWVEDCWSDSYAGAPTDGRAWTSGDCNRRVLRGGSWRYKPPALRSSFRFIGDPRA